MIQFNLLPDVKLQFIKAQRRKRLASVTSLSVIAVSLTILVLLFLGVNVLQKQHLTALSKDIDKNVKELQSTPDLDKILTVQNQLLKLSDLHAQKPVASRLFSYLTQVTPVETSIATLDINFDEKTMVITGSSSSLNNINKFADTLKFTTYNILEEGSDTPVEQGAKAFSDVVLKNFGRSTEAANYSIDLVFDSNIFDSAKNVKLVVPSTISTRSETEKPLFKSLEGEGQ